MIGSHVGLSFTDRGTGGVYRDDWRAPVVVSVVMPPVFAAVREPIGAAPARGNWPGLVPLGVTRPPVLRLGGATKKV